MTAHTNHTAACSGSSEGVLIEGYASRFDVADLSGDIVQAGAFARCLRARSNVAMLLQHRPHAVIGRWTRIHEDGCGLFVRGWVEAKAATSLIAGGLTGLSIGFRPRLWRALPGPGRKLADIDLLEISLVARPMLPSAAFTIV